MWDKFERKTIKKSRECVKTPRSSNLSAVRTFLDPETEGSLLADGGSADPGEEEEDGGDIGDDNGDGDTGDAGWDSDEAVGGFDVALDAAGDFDAADVVDDDGGDDVGADGDDDGSGAVDDAATTASDLART